MINLQLNYRLSRENKSLFYVKSKKVKYDKSTNKYYETPKWFIWGHNIYAVFIFPYLALFLFLSLGLDILLSLFIVLSSYFIIEFFLIFFVPLKEINCKEDENE